MPRMIRLFPQTLHHHLTLYHILVRQLVILMASILDHTVLLVASNR